MSALRLRSVAGVRSGQEFIFTGPHVRIGRSRDNDLILPDSGQPLASGHHAEAVLDSNGGWWIVDIGSTNGTRLNNVRIDRHELRSGDRLLFGTEEFAVTIARPHMRWLAAGIVLLAIGVGAAVAALWPARRPFEDIAAIAARSVYLLAVESGGSRSVIGTAFGVDGDNLLATNAHVAAALQRRGLSAVIAVQGDTFTTRHIVSAAIHPGWREGSVRNDVAVLGLDAGSPVPALRLASASAVQSLRRGTPVAAFGFAAVSTDPLRPRGRLSVDVVADVRDEYLEVGLGIAPGTSGSPVFTESGSVVAIVVGGDFVDNGGGAKRPSGSEVNWALSALVLRDFLASRH